MIVVNLLVPLEDPYENIVASPKIFVQVALTNVLRTFQSVWQASQLN